MRIKKTPKANILFQSIVSLLFFVLGVFAPPIRLCAAADEVVDPFDVYAADGSGEQLLHINWSTGQRHSTQRKVKKQYFERES